MYHLYLDQFISVGVFSKYILSIRCSVSFEDRLKVIIIEPDASVCHRHAEKSLVECAVDEISVTEAKGVITEDPVLIPRLM